MTFDLQQQQQVIRQQLLQQQVKQQQLQQQLQHLQQLQQQHQLIQHQLQEQRQYQQQVQQQQQQIDPRVQQHMMQQQQVLEQQLLQQQQQLLMLQQQLQQQQQQTEQEQQLQDHQARSDNGRAGIVPNQPNSGSPQTQDGQRLLSETQLVQQQSKPTLPASVESERNANMQQQQHLWQVTRSGTGFQKSAMQQQNNTLQQKSNVLQQQHQVNGFSVEKDSSLALQPQHRVLSHTLSAQQPDTFTKQQSEVSQVHISLKCTQLFFVVSKRIINTYFLIFV